MNNVFIINPNAGKKSGIELLSRKISEYFIKRGEPYDIFTTTSSEDATYIARREAEKGEKIRIFACGGDGTSFRVLNGIAGFDNVLFGVIPCGTGNDFLKTIGTYKEFTDIDNQINGKCVKIDVIKAGEYYSLNQASMGMDAAVCQHKKTFSRIPFVKGKGAYTVSLLYCFLYKIKNTFKISVDNGNEENGLYLFAIGANGRFCGGGYKSAPNAVLNDGLLDFVIIKSVSRAKIISLLKKYTDGTHIDLPITKIIKGKSMTLKATEETPINLDGEVVLSDSVTFEVVPKFINLIVPKSCYDKRPDSLIFDKE